MRVSGKNADANTAPNFFIPHVVATVDIACPTTPYNMSYTIKPHNVLSSYILIINLIIYKINLRQF